MKKALLRIMLVMTVVLLVFSFSAATCTVSGGGGGGAVLYTITVNNDFGEQLRIEVWDTTGWATRVDWSYVNFTLPNSSGSVQGYYGQYFRIYGMSSNVYYNFSSTGNSWYRITGNQTFGSGGWVISPRE